MRRLRHVASPDEVRITREPDGETALIEYANESIGSTHFKLGPKLRTMTDACCDRGSDPQLEWFELGQQWTPRGGVLRCVINDGGGTS